MSRAWSEEHLAHLGHLASVDRIEKDAERNFHLSADEAKTYGFVDEVILGAKLGIAKG